MRGVRHFLDQQGRRTVRFAAILLLAALVGHFGAVMQEQRLQNYFFGTAKVDQEENYKPTQQKNADVNGLTAQFNDLKNELGAKINAGITDLSEKSETVLKMKKLFELYDQLNVALAKAIYWLLFAMIAAVAFGLLNHLVPQWENQAQQENIEMLAKRIEMLEELAKRKT